jgi:hypothetical protein
MSVVTLEGVVKQGQVQLPTNLDLPDNTRVYVLIPGMEDKQRVHIWSPRLANPEQVTDFEMEVIAERDETSDD